MLNYCHFIRISLQSMNETEIVRYQIVFVFFFSSTGEIHRSPARCDKGKVDMTQYFAI